MFIVFWVLLVWSIYDGDLDMREASIFVALWAALMVCPLVSPSLVILSIVGQALLDVVLVLKIFGTNVRIR